MLVLGIESSCDETALALVKNGRLEDSIVSSQIDIHAIFGGVVPELASREHYHLIGPLFDRILKNNTMNPSDLSAIAVARGPGLLGSLLVGTAFAKALAFGLEIPLIGVNHLHAHLLVTSLEYTPEFPALGLLVSGGHTNLYLIYSPFKIEQLGATLDDAAGEIFDKIGQIIGLRYPAGKAIDELASRGDPHSFNLPRPYLENNSLDFSFSGLKSAAANLVQQECLREDITRHPDFCASFNYAIAETLVEKTSRAIAAHPDIRQIWLAGGVAANSLIRRMIKTLADSCNLPFLAPSPALCTDNGAMIANAGYLLLKSGFFSKLSMETIPRGKTIPDDYQRIIKDNIKILYN